MIAFADIEASSLSAHSYPIEVAWVFENGTGESHLIQPISGWTDRDPQVEAVHGISRDMLVAQGSPAADVARRLRDALGGRPVYSDAPVADAGWAAVLSGVAGLPPLPVRHVHDAYSSACRQLAQRMPASIASDMAYSFLRRAEEAADAAVVGRHRAAEDARRLWETWRRMTILVTEALEGWP
jgi:hypothetical protein